MPSVPGPVQVVVADARAPVRAIVAGALSGDVATCVVGQAGDAEELFPLLRDQRVDVLLIGNDLPRAGGLPLIGSVALQSPHTAIIVLSSDASKVDLAHAVAEGARGIVPHDAPAELLRKCVRCVAAGEFWISRDQVGSLAERLRQSCADAEKAARPFDRLTPRELDIVSAVVHGSSNKDIAGMFGLSPQTVKNHLSNIFLKLGVESRLELALAALHGGLMRPALDSSNHPR
jgi:DNA-binding NarL/FixJ family response regulator